jgi:hypothetical protein
MAISSGFVDQYENGRAPLRKTPCVEDVVGVSASWFGDWHIRVPVLQFFRGLSLDPNVFADECAVVQEWSEKNVVPFIDKYTAAERSLVKKCAKPEDEFWG